ncbi:MAG: hypothetical protein FJZ58_01830 [Chlamydiae bacterium]|nr:hypothetical protein [Chlamydiota bacterium]
MKMAFFVTALVAVCGFANADPSAVAPTAVAPACTLSAEEQAFAGKLSDVNKTIFCGMTEDERSQCMQMTGKTDNLGNTITPDQAVARVLGAGDCPSN